MLVFGMGRRADGPNPVLHLAAWYGRVSDTPRPRYGGQIAFLGLGAERQTGLCATQREGGSCWTFGTPALLIDDLIGNNRERSGGVARREPRSGVLRVIASREAKRLCSEQRPTRKRTVSRAPRVWTPDYRSARAPPPRAATQARGGGRGGGEGRPYPSRGAGLLN